MSMPFLQEDEKSILRNIHPAELFISDTFEAVQVGPGITLVVGKPSDPTLIQQLINPEKVLVQAVKFDKPDWTLESALDWLRDNQKKFTNYQHKKTFKNDLKSIKDVEIFSAGVWNGDKYTTKDLDGMVEAFNETHQTVRPFLKLGHSDKQKILEAEGLPAAGWIGRVFRKGDKLLADFVDMPRKIFELIEKKAYRKVSSEIYVGVKIKEKSYRYMLGAVALLGAETPGVMNLSDILNRFGIKDFESIKSYATTQTDDNITMKVYDFVNEQFSGEKIMDKTQREIELELELKAVNKKAEQLDKDISKYAADIKSNEEILKEEQQKREEAEKRAFAAEQDKKKAELEKQVEGLIGEKLITKAMRPYVLSLLGDEPKTKKYSFNEGDKQVEMNKFELVSKVAKLFSKVAGVNLDESSVDDEGKKTNEPSVEDIEKYAVDNKISYTAAYKELLVGKLEVEAEEKED